MITQNVDNLHQHGGVPDDRVLPSDDPARHVSEVLRTEFSSADADAYPIVAIGGVDDTIVADYAAAGVDELIVPDFTLGPMENKLETLDTFITKVAGR